MERDARIYIAGHGGMVGAALRRRLERDGAANLVLRTSAELDLREQDAVRRFFDREKPDYVFLAAAKVGGIMANSSYPADFIRDNLLIQTNVMDAAWKSGVKKLLFLGSSCIYPKFAPQPMPEAALLTGELEPTNEWYALAKISGIKMGQAYRRQHGFDVISAMPTNLYGPGDNFDPHTSHVVPAMMRRFHQARLDGASSVTIWGTGTPYREFLHVDDMADACVFLMDRYEGEEHVNVGAGREITIMELARLLAKVTGYMGDILTDPSKPDGTPRKLLDISKLDALGWKASIPLLRGLEETYAWFLDHPTVRGVLSSSETRTGARA